MSAGYGMGKRMGQRQSFSLSPGNSLVWRPWSGSVRQSTSRVWSWREYGECGRERKDKAKKERWRKEAKGGEERGREKEEKERRWKIRKKGRRNKRVRRGRRERKREGEENVRK